MHFVRSLVKLKCKADQLLWFSCHPSVAFYGMLSKALMKVLTDLTEFVAYFLNTAVNWRSVNARVLQPAVKLHELIMVRPIRSV